VERSPIAIAPATPRRRWPDCRLLDVKYNILFSCLPSDLVYCMCLHAGAFCTKDYAVGVAARAEREDKDYASFFAFGVGQPGSDDASTLPTMQLVSVSSSVFSACSQLRGDSLHVDTIAHKHGIAFQLVLV
jgi:hypothetical protein